MTQCPSTAFVMPGGAVVRCTLEAGHDIDDFTISPWDLSRHVTREATLHEVTLTWSNPEGEAIDPELYDPDEVFDLEVDIDDAAVALERATVPEGLCGLEGCVFLPHPQFQGHSWQS